MGNIGSTHNVQKQHNGGATVWLLCETKAGEM
jgi:hypothetical protein